MDIRLNNTNSKRSTNKQIEINIGLDGNKRILPQTSINDVWDMYELYEKERKESDKIRLTVTINPICSNLFFNTKTEIVKNEGGLNVSILNYEPQPISGTYFKSPTMTWTQEKAIKDTQINNQTLGWDYHCGADIFNNHILRANVFKSVSIELGTNKTEIFNTIEDFARDYNGNPIKFLKANSNTEYNKHLYERGELDSIDETKTKQLIELNGWFGFSNKGFINNVNKTGDILYYNKVINNREICDFIEMYPDSRLYSFAPLYNQRQHREEENWVTYLTYPSSSTTVSDMIDQDTLGLRAVYVDETNNELIIYSVAKHGLFENDRVNVYIKNTGEDPELFLVNARVLRLGSGDGIDNEYTFSVENNGKTITDGWVAIKDLNNPFIPRKSGVTYSITDNGLSVKIIDNQTVEYKKPIIKGRVSLENRIFKCSFKKVVNNVECQYYVRIFSKLPNFKFAKEPITFETANNKSIIQKYSNENNQFEKHYMKLAFAKNIYSDNLSQVVFTDDINIKLLKDNLGRPLSDIYLTVLKNNAGYKEWYGINGNQSYNILKKSYKNRTKEELNTIKSIEYSHCFGKLTCGFKNSFDSLRDVNIRNVILNNSEKPGLSMTSINRSSINRNNGNDEVLIKEDFNFYGDLCCFSPSEYNEETISDSYFRFNTAQRELNSNDLSYNNFKTITEDILTSDDYDTTPFKVKQVSKNCEIKKEGYYYKSHYKIPIHGFSSELETQYPKEFDLLSFNLIRNRPNMQIFSGETSELNYLEVGDVMFLHDYVTNTNYNFKITDVMNSGYTEFKCLYIGKGLSSKTIDEIKNNIDNVKLEKKDTTIPENAIMLNDNTCRFVWREWIPNGVSGNKNEEVLSFSNGAFYSTKNFNIYLLRQDPYPFNPISVYTTDGYSLKNKNYPLDPDGVYLEIEKENNYTEETKIKC